MKNDPEIPAQKVGTSVATTEGVGSSTGPAVIEEPEHSSPIGPLEEKYRADAEEVSKPKRKYTRRAKPEDEEDPKEKIAAFGSAGKLLLRFVAVRMPNPLPPSPEEENAFADALGEVIVKYLPSAGEYEAEATLGIVSLGFILPRIIKPTPEEKAE